jgi:hypothetical protein
VAQGKKAGRECGGLLGEESVIYICQSLTLAHPERKHPREKFHEGV